MYVCVHRCMCVLPAQGTVEGSDLKALEGRISSK